MKRFLLALRALAILAGSWGVLILVGWLAGVIPPRPSPPRSEAPPPRPTAPAPTPIAAPAAHDAGPSRPDATPLAVEESVAVPDADVAPEPAIPRHAACDGEAAVSLATPRLSSVGHPLLFVACGGHADVVGFVRTVEGGAQPVRVARFDVPVGPQEAPVRGLHVVAEDLTGDGAIDWAIGTRRALAPGAPQSGGVFLLPGDGRGSLGAPRSLGDAAVAGLVTGHIDGNTAADLVVLHQPDSVGRRASEAWVYAGGSPPVRGARLRLGSTGRAIALVDRDGDGSLDLVGVSDRAPALAIARGDGSGRFGAPVSLEAPGVVELAVGTFVAGAGPTAWLVGDGITRLPTADESEAERVAERAPRGVRAVDLDGDGVSELVGLLDGVLMRSRPNEDRRTFTFEPWLETVPAAGRVVAVAVADLLGSPTADVVLLLEHGTERDWVVVVDADEPRRVVPAEARVPVPDAPIVLTIELR